MIIKNLDDKLNDLENLIDQLTELRDKLQEIQDTREYKAEATTQDEREQYAEEIRDLSDEVEGLISDVDLDSETIRWIKKNQE